MKFDFQKLSGQIIKIGTPIVLAATAYKAATGKLDLKGPAIAMLTQILASGTASA